MLQKDNRLMQPTLKKLMQNYFSTIKLSIQNAIKSWFHYEVHKTLKYNFWNKNIINMSWVEKEKHFSVKKED